MANLDKFLPRIREIIINLLQGLKRKQQIHRLQSGEAAAPVRMRRTDSQGTTSSPGSRSTGVGLPSMNPNSGPSPRSNSPAISSTGANQTVNSVRNLPPPNMASSVPNPSQNQPPRRAPDPPTQMPVSQGFTPAPPIPSNSDAVIQLSQMNLERRSSKRFSENYLARLTSSPTLDRSGKLSVDEVRKNIQKQAAIPESIEDESNEDVEYSASRAYGSPPPKTERREATIASPSLPSPTYKAIPAPRVVQADTTVLHSREQLLNGDHERTPPSIIFVKHENATKKASFEGEITIVHLKETICKMYRIDSEITLEIEDPVSKVAYELEDPDDIKQRSILIVRSVAKTAATATIEAPAEGHKRNEELTELRAWLDNQFSSITNEIVQLKESHTPAPSRPEMESDLLIRDVEAKRAASPDLNQATELHEQLRKAEAVNEELRNHNALLQSELDQERSSEKTSSAVSTHRDQVISMSAKHEHRGTELTAKLEEAMNTMERIRKDVLQRKVTPRPQQLIDLTKEFEDIRTEADALAANLVKLDVVSNKLWEEELTVITTEQETLDYQRMFLDDIKADLEQSLSSLTTIKQVEEQKRVHPVGSVPMMTATTADPSRALKFVQADIKSLQVNHERRAAAIADAEKQREKERGYLIENEFKNELGSFVESKGLKNTGGAAEIDRLREERDDAHRKLLFTPVSTPSEDLRSESPIQAPSAGDSTPLSQEAVARASGESGPSRPGSSKSISSASILAKIDASKKDIMDKRRTSMTLQHGNSPERPKSATASTIEQESDD